MIADMNWNTIIQDLLDAGLTQVSIAQECDTGQSHISALYRGDRKNPNWPLGQRLIDLHARHCSKVAA